jgi:hypothetical protein
MDLSESVGNHFFSADSFFFNKENFFPVTLKKLPIVCQSKVFVREQQTSIF